MTLKRIFKTFNNCNKIAELMRLLSNTNFDYLKQILTSSCIYFQQGIVGRAILNPSFMKIPPILAIPLFQILSNPDTPIYIYTTCYVLTAVIFITLNE